MILDKTGYEPDNSSDEEQYETEELLMENLQRDRIEEPGISLNENMGKEDLPKKDKTKIITNKKSIIKKCDFNKCFCDNSDKRCESESLKEQEQMFSSRDRSTNP